MYIERGSLVVDWFCIDHCSRQNGCSPPAEVHVGGGGGGGGIWSKVKSHAYIYSDCFIEFD